MQEQPISKQECILDMIIEVPELKSLFTELTAIANSQAIFCKDILLSEIEDRGLIETSLFNKEYSKTDVNSLKDRLHFSSVINIKDKIKDMDISFSSMDFQEQYNTEGAYLEARIIKDKLRRAKLETFKNYENFYGEIDE